MSGMLSRCRSILPFLPLLALFCSFLPPGVAHDSTTNVHTAVDLETVADSQPYLVGEINNTVTFHTSGAACFVERGGHNLMLVVKFQASSNIFLGVPVLMVYGKDNREVDNGAGGWVLSQAIFLNNTFDDLSYMSSSGGEVMVCRPDGEILVLSPVSSDGLVIFKATEVEKGCTAQWEVPSTPYPLPFTWEFAQLIAREDGFDIFEPIVLSSDGLQLLFGAPNVNEGSGIVFIYTAPDLVSNYTFQGTLESGQVEGGVKTKWGARMSISKDQTTLAVGCRFDSMFTVFTLSDPQNSSSWEYSFQTESKDSFYQNCVNSVFLDDDGSSLYNYRPEGVGYVDVWARLTDTTSYILQHQIHISPPEIPIEGQNLLGCGCSLSRHTTYRTTMSTDEGAVEEEFSNTLAMQCASDVVMNGIPRTFGLTFIFSRRGGEPYKQTNILFPTPTTSPDSAGDIQGVFVMDPSTGTLLASTKKALYDVHKNIPSLRIYNGTRCFGGSFLADELDHFNCTLCPRGTSSDVFGASDASVCKPCSAGMHARVMGSVNCSECGVGTFAPVEGSSSCDLCEPGTFAREMGLTTCDECLPGRASLSSGSSSCRDCRPGKFNAGMGMSICQDCAAGTFSNDTGRVAPCTSCNQGSFSGPGQVICDLCIPGTFADTRGSSTCDRCAVGSASNGTGLGVPCPLCKPGTISGEEGLLSCEACGVGTYAQEHGLSSCDECASGRFLNLTGADSSGDCMLCPKGSFSPLGGSSSCSLCHLGQYAKNEGLSSCTSCSAGRFLPFRGADSKDDCEACPLGRYALSQGWSQCLNCKAGRYSAAMGSIDCTACAAGTASPNEGGTSKDSCVPCGPGSFSQDEGSATCTVCPMGQYCPSAQNRNPIPCMGGTYNDKKGSVAESACKACVAGRYCPTTESGNALGINCTEGHYCPSGAEQPILCSECGRDKFITHACNETNNVVCVSRFPGDRDSTPWYEEREVYASIGSVSLSLFIIILYWFWHRYRRSQHPLPNHVYTKLHLNFGDFTSGYGILFVKFVLDVHNDVLRKAEIASIDQTLFVNSMCMALEELELVEHRGKYCFVCPKYPFCGRFIHERSLHDSSTVDAVSDRILLFLQDSRVGLLSLFNGPIIEATSSGVPPCGESEVDDEVTEVVSERKRMPAP